MFPKALTLLAALLAVTPGFASDRVPGKTETATATVMLAAVDLSTTAGLAQARKQLTLEAGRLCRKFRDDRKASDWATYVDCVHDTVASALGRMQTSATSVARN